MYINEKIFKDVWFETLEPEEKLLYMYCLIIADGDDVISFDRIAFDTGIKADKLQEVFDEIETYCSYDHDNYKIVCEPIDELK